MSTLRVLRDMNHIYVYMHDFFSLREQNINDVIGWFAQFLRQHWIFSCIWRGRMRSVKQSWMYWRWSSRRSVQCWSKTLSSLKTRAVGNFIDSNQRTLSNSKQWDLLFSIPNGKGRTTLGGKKGNESKILKYNWNKINMLLFSDATEIQSRPLAQETKGRSSSASEQV